MLIFLLSQHFRRSKILANPAAGVRLGIYDQTDDKGDHPRPIGWAEKSIWSSTTDRIK
jgi:hypothetical protein